jgi:hypothetical protein
LSALTALGVCGALPKNWNAGRFILSKLGQVSLTIFRKYNNLNMMILEKSSKPRVLFLLFIIVVISGYLGYSGLWLGQRSGLAPIQTEQTVPEFVQWELLQYSLSIQNNHTSCLIFITGGLLAILTGKIRACTDYFKYRLRVFRNTPVMALSLGGRAPPQF